LTVIAVLAGGKSSRFGSDKALARVGGATYLERVVSAALESGKRVMVVGRRAAADWSIDRVEFLEDEQPGAGPLGGLITALRCAGEDALLCGCDMPLVGASAFEWLMRELPAHDGDGVAVTSGGRLEPLFALYRISCLPHAERRLAAREMSLHGLIEGAAFHRVEAPPWVQRMLRNVNTPGEAADLNAGGGAPA
jgi:molybdenum cofactor guanylyltransferase